MKKIIITCSQNFNDYLFAKKHIDSVLSSFNRSDLEIVSGHAKKGDSIAEQYAYDNRLSCTVFPRISNEDGNKADYIRNNQMIEYSSNDGYVIGFWDGSDDITKDMLLKAKKYGLKLKICQIKNENRF